MNDAKVVLRIDGMESVNVLRDLDYGAGDPAMRMDVYRPVGSGPWPVVVFVHGDGEPEALASAKDWGQYQSWGRLVAAKGMVGVTFTHRSWEGLRQIRHKVLDVAAAMRFVRAKARSWGADPSRLCVWSCSAGVPVGLTTAIDARATCAVAYYGPADLRPFSDLPAATDLSPVARVERGDALPPTFVVKAGLDRPELNETIDAFVAAAAEHGLHVEAVDHAEGRHGFDVLDDTEDSRRVIARTLEFMVEQLVSPAPATA